MLESVTELVAASPWTYAVVLSIAALDAIFPVVPSETTAIAAGVLAAAGDLNIALVIAAAATGALIGDSGTYTLGRLAGERATRRLPARRVEWAERTLQKRGGYLIVVSRFIPGGRTVTMLSAGLTKMPARGFCAWRRSRRSSGAPTPACSATSAAARSRRAHGTVSCSRWGSLQALPSPSS
jgi:membrane-associated protein